ncbi:Ube3d, partial [Columba guinea]
KSKENTRVICKRCKTMLGETVSPDTIKYYVTEVIIQPSEGSFTTTPRSQFVQSMVAQCLVELSSAKSTFRFTIEGDDGKIYILVLALRLLVDLTAVGRRQSERPGGKMQASDMSSVRILCLVVSTGCANKRLADTWENDIGVHPLKFPSETCLELLLILALSTSSLPPSLRCMNSFQVRNNSYFSIKVLLLGKRKLTGAYKPFQSKGLSFVVA